VKVGQRLLRILVALGAAALSLSAHAGTWHVSSQVSASGDGSPGAPFLTVKEALDAAAQAGGAAEIVLHAGTYPGDIMIPAPVPAGGAAIATGDVAPWIITAAAKSSGDFEEVTIDGGQKITQAVMIDEAKGVYFVRFYLANFEPSMWEAQNRIRYAFVADRRAVEAFPASLAPGQYMVEGEMRTGVFFRTSDSKPPSAHDLGLARDRFGMIVRRPNVTIKGLHFRNFQLYLGVQGVSIQAANVTVDSCHGWNCFGLVGVSEGELNARIINCTARDGATGVKSYGKNTIVDNCRFFRVDDGFVVQENEQDQCGIQFYSSHVQTARGNLCVGFQAGIFIKASGGVATLENNTIVAPEGDGDRGIGPNTWREGSVCRGNIVVGYREPISLATLKKETSVRDNIVWHPTLHTAMEEAATRIKLDANGETLVAEPVFVNPKKDDYRLAANSPGAKVGPQGATIGALGTAPQGTAVVPRVATKPDFAAANHPPRLVGEPAVYANEHGAVVIFKTDRPCLSALQWGAANPLEHRIDDPRNWRNEGFNADDPQNLTSPHTDHCLAIIGSAVAGASYAYQILLSSGAEDAVPVHRGEFTLKGSPRTLHVSVTGKDDETGGASEHPLATLQYAVDRALPGDRVLVAPGIYTGSVWMTHGGVAGHPIRIESQEPWNSPSGGAILDGQRAWDSAIRIGRKARVLETWKMGPLTAPVVSHVQISGFEMRWYNGLCVHADESTDLLVEGCKFWGRHYVKGRPGTCEGVGAFHCERVTIDRCLFLTVNSAVRFNISSGLRLTNNTAAKCFHRVIGIVNSEGLYLRNNSFAFGASYLLQIHGVELNQIDSDYNNFAVNLRLDSVDFESVPAEEKLQHEAKDFYYGESKSLSAWDERTPEKPSPYLQTLSIWRAATGQDKHSIAIHPRYADPLNQDFRLLPNSPNLGKGEHGGNIGAFGATTK
jgi:hypothetical protein